MVLIDNGYTMDFIGKNKKTGDVVELSTDWMFDDRYGYFILQEKKDWEFSVLKCDLTINLFVEILKRTLEGNDEVRVEFESEEDNINYILDVCNNFKKELEKVTANKHLPPTK